MQLTIERTTLKTALDRLAKVVPSRLSQIALTGVRIEAIESGDMLLEATDLEVRLTERATADVSEPGVVLLDADTLRRIAGTSTAETLTITAGDDSAIISAADESYTLYALPVAEFPLAVPVKDKWSITINAAKLREMLASVSFAVATEGTRYAIHGVLFTLDHGVFEVVATDGRRLALNEFDIGGGAILSKILPAKAVRVLNAMLSDVDGDAHLTFYPDSFCAAVGQGTLSGQLLEGKFPDINDVIPKQCPHSAEMRRDDLLSALRRAAILTDHESKGVRFEFEGKVLTLSARAPERGEATVTMPIEYDGPVMAIGFKPSYILDMLKAVPVERFEFRMTAPDKSCLFVADSYRYVVMPVSLGGVQ